MKHAHLLKHPQLPKPDYTPIRNVLQELMPVLSPDSRGRARLHLALTHRFGENFRMNEQAKQAVAHFDSETARIKLWFKQRGVQDG